MKEASERRAPTEQASETVGAAQQTVSVVIATLGRQPWLTEIVSTLLHQTYEPLEIVVVDNDPSSGATRGLLAGVDDPRVRVVEQPIRGVSAARNAGLRVVRGSLVAFTDDDAMPDPEWLEALVHVIADDRRGVVSCVTGRVIAAETDTAEQGWFESLGVFDKGEERTVWSLGGAEEPALGRIGRRTVFFPYTAGEMGSGNNMLFRTEHLRGLGGFDEALGAGTSARGGEDLDVYRRVVLSGHVLVYTPESIVRHHHRATYAALRSQMFGYGVGMAASLTKVLVGGGRPAVGVLRCFPRGVYTLLAPSSTKNQKNPSEMPSALIRMELLGYAAGPWLYLVSRFRGLRNRRTASTRVNAARGVAGADG